MSDSRYPIGTFKLIEDALTTAERQAHIQQLADLPAQLAAVVASAGNEQMQHSYRPGGWTRHQVVHHLADSHLHGYTRFRLALTENNPTVRPYNEKVWAELADVSLTPVAISLSLLAALHARWVTLLRILSTRHWHSTPGTVGTIRCT
jgi:hypothetical protein